MCSSVPRTTSSSSPLPYDQEIFIFNRKHQLYKINYIRERFQPQLINANIKAQLHDHESKNVILTNIGEALYFAIGRSLYIYAN